MKKNIPKIAMVGKPNVGKSTLINRICSSTEAIVHKQPMITRDRKYYNSDWNGVEFYILDTGGIDLKSGERLSSQIFLQTKKAIEESDLIIFLVDLKEPLSLKMRLMKIYQIFLFWDSQMLESQHFLIK
jgi:GTP-binding protein